jgi:Tfp pilus assembly protein PilN
MAILLVANWAVFASPSNAYADAVLEALQQKGILSENEVSAIKLKASTAERVSKHQQEKSTAQEKAAPRKNWPNPTLTLKYGAGCNLVIPLCRLKMV